MMALGIRAHANQARTLRVSEPMWLTDFEVAGTSVAQERRELALVTDADVLSDFGEEKGAGWGGFGSATAKLVGRELVHVDEHLGRSGRTLPC